MTTIQAAAEAAYQQTSYEKPLGRTMWHKAFAAGVSWSNKWIDIKVLPVQEPGEVYSEEFLLCDKDGIMEVGHYSFEREQWSKYNIVMSDPVKYMKLPTP